MPRQYLLAFLPISLLACSAPSPAGPPRNGTTSGSTSGDGSGGNVADATSGGGGGSSGGGSEGPPVTPDAGAAEMDAAADGTPDGDGQSTASDDGGPCSGLLCEDFEQGQGQLDLAKWVLQKNTAVDGGIEEIQQQMVHRGKYAWHVHVTAAPGDFAVILTKSPPAMLKGSGPVFGRTYFYATANVGTHIMLGIAGTTHDPAVAPSILPIKPQINFNYMEFAAYAGSWQLGFDLFAPDPSIAKGFVEEASYPPARDKYPTMAWSCIEWEFSDNPDAMMFWVDGKPMDQFDLQHIGFSSVPRTMGSILNGKSSGIIGGFDFFGFGFHTWGRSPAFEIYYDDIVLDTKRVNCLP
ncbi:MAG TPA: hypothetical protein VGY54_15785 [Polyangiaceae bacterium]|nr:hypothetical protein [Polyangiaceae bacterium]